MKTGSVSVYIGGMGECVAGGYPLAQFMNSSFRVLYCIFKICFVMLCY